MRNKLLSFCLILVILATLPLTALADSFDYNRKGSISVTLATSAPAQPMVGAELTLYHVAEAAINSQGVLNFVINDVYEAGGIDLEDPELISKLDAFVAERSLPVHKIVTDAQGSGTCSNLPLGLYFVRQTGGVEGFASCAPFLVTLPMETDDGYTYQVNATPKTDIAKMTDITVKKVWNTGSTTGLPTSIKVQLLLDGVVIETATLSKDNNWQVTYTDMPQSDGYTIKEEIPTGYTATYSNTGYVFTVTNTPGLAQTGQLIWPIPVFAMAGILLLMLGILILRKPGKYHA